MGDALVVAPMPLYDDIPESRIFKNRSALKEESGGKPVNQKTVRTALQSMVELLKKDNTPPLLYLSGPPGCGKTHLTRCCFEQGEPSGTTEDVSTVWIRQMTRTKNRNGLRHLWRQFDNQLPAPSDSPQLRCSSSKQVVQERIQQRLQTLTTPVVVILDEFALTDTVQSLLREVLLPLRTETTEIPLGMVFLSYKVQYETLADCFDEGGPVHLELDHYTHEEMVKILSQRARDAFQSGAVNKEILRQCAKITIEREATPREALELLLRTGDAASRTGESTVSGRHVQKGVAKMESTTWG